MLRASSVQTRISDSLSFSLSRKHNLLFLYQHESRRYSNKMSQDFQRWFDEMMPKIINNLGPNVDNARYELLESNNNFIMSNLYRVRLQFENKRNGQKEELSMILKRPMLGFSQLAHIDLQFRNEILFYQMYTRPNEIYARCIYAEEKPPIDSIIALENVNERGYYSCPYPYDPPLEYTLAVMRELGRFHGKGYVMKERQREKFFDIVARIQHVRYIKRVGNLYEHHLNIKTLRVIEYLRNQGYDAIFCDKMEALLSNAFDEVMMKSVQPSEPLATLCHGDFTLSNMLFKTEDDGQYRLLLIDFALITYSTPVIDICTYLFICCSNEVRKDKFSEIMLAYHDALKEYLWEAGIKDIEKYSYNALMDDFRKSALFALPLMCNFSPILWGYLNPKILVQEIIDLGPVESAKKRKYVGGDKVSKLLADALLHLRDLGCLNHIL
ncbi:uncharacterized protein LOC105202091 [Solenopsis invicta]|uniref:uncharacterized protein LOC105202091 n=1 Tax=Solenopsis invicta TaxID=13686 RepID=UPI00193DD5EB|nr:uncharacterized protein LOC105202091 [Solenopsis invicta]